MSNSSQKKANQKKDTKENIIHIEHHRVGWKIPLSTFVVVSLMTASVYIGLGLFDTPDSYGNPLEGKKEEKMLLAGLGDNLDHFFQRSDAATPQEKQQDPVAALPEPEFKASTWFSDYAAMKANVQYYNEIHPFIYGMQGKSTNNGKLYSTWGSSSIRERVKELRMLNPRVKIIPTIFRWENKTEKISENIGMNGRTDIRDKHIQIILGEVEKYGYDGIDIDYEGMSCEKKDNFETFIKILSQELKKRHKILSVSVHPKTKSKGVYTKSCQGEKRKLDFAENWRGPMTHDYAFLGKHADRIKIMAYELHPRKYRNPGPGPQAPNAWIEKIIEYASGKVPTHKLFMAIPTYGYDWALNCKSSIKAVYYSDAKRRLSLGHKIQPTNISAILDTSLDADHWGNLSKFAYVHKGKIYEDPSIWYSQNGCDHVAFYMNERAFASKMNLLRKYNLGGFSFWQLLSDNDPAINAYLAKLVRNELPRLDASQELVQRSPTFLRLPGKDYSKKKEKPEKLAAIDSREESEFKDSLPDGETEDIVPTKVSANSGKKGKKIPASEQKVLDESKAILSESRILPTISDSKDKKPNTELNSDLDSVSASGNTSAKTEMRLPKEGKKNGESSVQKSPEDEPAIAIPQTESPEKSVP